MKLSRQFPFYCIIFSAYPALAMMAFNITEDSVISVIRPLFFSIMIGLIILFISNLLYRNINKAGLFTLFTIILFFSFGHIHQLLDGKMLFHLDLGRIRVTIGVFTTLFLLGIVGIHQIKSVPTGLSSYLLIVGLVLISFSSVKIITYLVQKNDVKTTEGRDAALPIAGANISQDLPDVYLIILDAYTRQDVLLSTYKYDNQPFLDQLRSRGFYIADCSMSNYQHTLLSLSSMLNMDYLQNLDTRFQPGNYRVDFMEELIQHSKVREDLEKAGYKTITFLSSYNGTHIDDADEVIKMPENEFVRIVGGFINPFEEMFINSTAAMIVYQLPDGKIRDYIESISFPYSDLVKVQLYQLDTLPKVVAKAGPKFVFFHMNIPHKPFILKSNGEIQPNPDIYGAGAITKNGIVGYTNQVAFLNSQIPAIVDEILANSKTDPIIIIQGDHGIAETNWSAILNSYYVPDSIREKLYQSITPVNSFRIILNELLGKNYPILPDHIYESGYQTRFDITEIFDPNPVCEK